MMLDPRQDGRSQRSVFSTLRATKRQSEYGFNHRHLPGIVDAKSIVESGSQGRIIWVRGVYGKSAVVDCGDRQRGRRLWEGACQQEQECGREQAAVTEYGFVLHGGAFGCCESLPGWPRL